MPFEKIEKAAPTAVPPAFAGQAVHAWAIAWGADIRHKAPARTVTKAVLQKLRSVKQLRIV
jgi:hypothetical protein